ncbi:hypothetical protein XAP412_770048 [Xanthomonas phaseoli pv. phaseoli]|uniref:Transposase n=2 Tax=Xanthomonas TaxID=338 RepID=A0AB38E510_XANCH|nr:hypothetical protein XAP6984_810050 [Xanthomonas phaseoli pv. phaseoli]SON90245.1 hypothetical protein XAP412_770048 [Xanthomonas phaseoli pv. phaseoli]SON92492.1 hypothetical protein XAP7430_770050 [Xanthomonas phaseoli pv. phaseoli]
MRFFRRWRSAFMQRVKAWEALFLKTLAVDAASACQTQTLLDIDTHVACQEAAPDDCPVGSVCR